MRRLVFLLLLISSCSIFARTADREIELVMTPLQVHRLFVAEYSISTTGLLDIIDKEEKVEVCIRDYIKKQPKSYLRIAQSNLFDLMNNFDTVVSKLYGKKALSDNIPHEEKIEALATVQCDAYYKMGVLK